MYDLKQESPNNIKQKIIFVIGTGRSGTHWLGYILESHPYIKATIEERAIFGLVTKIALNQHKKNKIYPKLVKKYKRQLQSNSQYHYMDKSPPNIWLAEDLTKTFDHAKFIGIIRNPYATISSMLKHPGVVRWHENWKRYPIPNQFLGITPEIAKNYETMTIVEKCMLRWISHLRQMKFLQSILNSKLLVVTYEDLIENGEEPLRKIKDFLELSYSPTIKETKKESLNKWKKYLTEKQINKITKMLESHKFEQYIQSVKIS